MNNTNFDNLSFEEAISMLESAVKKLESGNMALDESLEEYEKAVILTKMCNEKLEAAERRVRLLTVGSDSVVTDVPFEFTDET